MSEDQTQDNHTDPFAPRARFGDRSHRVGSLYETPMPIKNNDEQDESEEESGEGENYAHENALDENYAHENELDENHAHENELEENDASAARPHVRNSTGAEIGLRTGLSQQSIAANITGTDSPTGSTQIQDQRPPSNVPTRTSTSTTPQTTKKTRNSGSIADSASPIRSVGADRPNSADDTRVRMK